MSNEVPVFTTQEERRMLWLRAGDDPFIAIRNARRGFLFMYHMQTTGTILTNPTVREIRDTAKPYRMDIGPTSQTELVGGEVGQHTGIICCSTEDDAQALAAEVAPLIRNPDNWERG